MPIDPEKNRVKTLRALIPIVKDRYPDGKVTRPQLLAACEEAGVPCSHWLTSRTLGRGFYDLSSYYLVDLSVSDNPDDEGEREKPDTRSDEEVSREVSQRFAALDVLAEGVATGAFRSMILSGPPGVGKSYGLENILAKSKDVKYERVSGFSRATGLYRLLWDHREDDHVLLVDDCDSVFNDEVAIGLLKCACDSSKARYVAWRSETTMVDDEGEPLPRHFEFRGRFIFITNLDFEARSESDKGLAPHLRAMLSRAYYVDLNLDGRELYARVMDVANAVLKDDSAKDRELVLSYIREQAGVMRELSIRTVTKARDILAQCRAQFRDSSRAEKEFRRISDLTLVSRRLA